MGKTEDERRVERVLRSIQQVNNRKQWAQRSLRDKYGQHPRCVYCDAFADTIDHVLPRSKGGSYLLPNVVPCCEPCNNQKGDKYLEMFLHHRPLAAFRFLNLAVHAAEHHRQVAAERAVRYFKDREQEGGAMGLELAHQTLWSHGILVHADILRMLRTQDGAE